MRGLEEKGRKRVGKKKIKWEKGKREVEGRGRGNEE